MTGELRCGTQILAGHLAGRIDETAVSSDLLLREVKAQRAILFAELDGERQANVSKANHSNGSHDLCGVSASKFVRGS